ncbi:unnamed protein product [Oikopleura dioica]|uniref:Sulfotransferase n=1 Tax=Oikopleura dioica TaxID=34765 RepID=E4YDK7_OIKDI|nr:unnamed protein product [Oikopleura dioica]
MFNDMLRHRLPEFQYFLNDIAVHEGNGTIPGLVNAMLDRLDGAQRPFHVKSQFDLVERILSDGFYATFHLRWLQYFNRKQLLVIDGTELLEKPWRALEKIQDFLKIDKLITRKNFVLSKEGLQCFRERVKDTEHWCVGGDKGRTLDKKFDMDVGFALDTLFGKFYGARSLIGILEVQFNCLLK